MKMVLNVNYLIDQNYNTGTCAVLVKGKERSLVAKLGAASHYKFDHIKSMISEVTNYLKTIFNFCIIFSHNKGMLKITQNSSTYQGFLLPLH